MTRGRQKCCFIILGLASCLAVGQANRRQPRPIEIVAVRRDGVDLKFRSMWPDPVRVMVCDRPPRLDAVGYDLEAQTPKGWKRLQPREGIILGDLPPHFLEIGDGRTDSLPARFDLATFGAKPTSRLRIVVRAWHTERNVIGFVYPVSQKPILLTSAPFVLKPELR